jgi:hypothetical protein
MRDVTRRARTRVAVPLEPHTEAGQYPSVHARWDPLTGTDPLALPPRATRLTRTGRLHRPVPPGLWRRHCTPPRLAASLCPYLDCMADARDGRDSLLKARTPIKGVKLIAARIAQAPSRHCRCQWCPRRAPPSGRLHYQRVLLVPALGSPVAPSVACCSGQAASSQESELPRPPPGSLCQARASAFSPSQWALVAPPLGHTEALCAAHCSAEPFPSTDFATPRQCYPCATAAAHRRSLRPSYHRQSLRGELNRCPVPLVGQLRRPLAGGELPCAASTPVL